MLEQPIKAMATEIEIGKRKQEQSLEIFIQDSKRVPGMEMKNVNIIDADPFS